MIVIGVTVTVHVTLVLRPPVSCTRIVVAPAPAGVTTKVLAAEPGATVTTPVFWLTAVNVPA